MEGPSNSTIHVGAEALLTQFTRNSTDSWDIGLDWKPVARTSFSYDEFISHYKGDTSWQLTGLNYQLSNGTPVSLGIDISSLWATPCAAPFITPGIVNPNCNAFLSYNRSAPTRTLFPTEQILFQSATLPKLSMNGRFLYSATTSTLNNFNELFNGLESRTALRQTLVTGSAHIRRINVNGDFTVRHGRSRRRSRSPTLSTSGTSGCRGPTALLRRTILARRYCCHPAPLRHR